MGLKLDRRLGEGIIVKLGEKILKIRVILVKGNRVRLEFDGPEFIVFRDDSTHAQPLRGYTERSTRQGYPRGLTRLATSE